LTRDWAGWPAGTVGAVVSEYSAAALVEVVTEASVDAHGLPKHDLLSDLVTVPYTALRVVAPVAVNAG